MGTRTAKSDILTPRIVDVQALADGSAALLGAGQVTETSFSSGSLGIRAVGKLQVNDDRYQVTLQYVRIGTKDAAQGK